MNASIPIHPATSASGYFTINNQGASTTGHTFAPTNNNGSKIHVQGDAVFEGNITWQDRDMREWFESVESRLAILHPNLELEAEWSELAELRTRYVELERELLAKQRTFDILKKS
jgi:hypothetical protein